MSRTIQGALGPLRKSVDELRAKAQGSEVLIHLGRCYHELGTKYLRSSLRKDAESCFRAALECHSGNGDALGQLLEILERSHRLAEAQDVILRAEAEVGDLLLHHRPSYYFKCLLEFRAGRLQEAKSLLQGLACLNEEWMAQILLAQVLDQLGEYDQAFRLVTEAGENQGRNSPFWAESRSFLEGLASKTRFYGRQRAQAVTPFSSEKESSLVFLVGYSRSGTTLLQHILEAHSGVSTIEEEGRLNFCDEFMASPGRVLGLSSQQRRLCQEGYWRSIERKGLEPVVIIDKMPFNIAYLDCIARIFPSAKILVAVRDPRDVVISNLFQNFRLNRMMIPHCSLEETVKQYGIIMNFYAECRRRFNPNILEVRYESLTEDLPTTIEKVVNFLGLIWEPTILEYRNALASRHIKTPSYRQVVKPLYKSSVGRWHNYKVQLKPFLPILNPLARTLGYV